MPKSMTLIEGGVDPGVLEHTVYWVLKSAWHRWIFVDEFIVENEARDKVELLKAENPQDEYAILPII